MLSYRTFETCRSKTNRFYNSFIPYSIPSEIFSNTFKNFSGLAYTNVHNTPLTDSFYITNAFPGRYSVFYVTGHYCIFYVIGHIAVLFYLYVSISVCVGLCITTCICPAFYAVILVINIFIYLYTDLQCDLLYKRSK